MRFRFCPVVSYRPLRAVRQVACYPIMFPIYIADFQYEKAEKETRSVTVVLDAHEDSVRPLPIPFLRSVPIDLALAVHISRLHSHPSRAFRTVSPPLSLVLVHAE